MGRIASGRLTYINDSMKNMMANLQIFKPTLITIVPMIANAFYYNIWFNAKKSGKAENAETVKKLIDSGLFVEIGGGIRSEEQIEKYLSYGTKRVILGTVAVKNPSFVKEMAQKFPNKIAVGVDASNERVAISGWREITDINSYDFCKKMRDIGVENIIYTDISKDGALSGTNLFAYEKLVKIEGLKITASGGITYLNEIKTLKEMGVYGAILGKALYENKINLAEAVKLAQGD